MKWVKPLQNLRYIFLALLIIQVVFLPDMTFAAESKEKEQTYLLKVKDDVALETFIEEHQIASEEVTYLKEIQIELINLLPSRAKELVKDERVDFMIQDTEITLPKETLQQKKIQLDSKGKTVTDVLPLKIAIIGPQIGDQFELSSENKISFGEERADSAAPKDFGNALAKEATKNLKEEFSLYSAEIMDEKGKGTYSSLLQGINWAVEKKARIIVIAPNVTEQNQALDAAIVSARLAGIKIQYLKKFEQPKRKQQKATNETLQEQIKADEQGLTLFMQTIWAAGEEKKAQEVNKKVNELNKALQEITDEPRTKSTKIEALTRRNIKSSLDNKEELKELAGKYREVFNNAVALLDDMGAVSRGIQGADIFEPNDTPEQAHEILPGSGLHESYITTKDDMDYFKFTAEITGHINIGLLVPAYQDYDLEVFDMNGRVIQGGYASQGSNEYVDYVPIEKGQTYYIKVFPKDDYFGYYDPDHPYRLAISNPIIPLDSPVDISLPVGEEKIFMFNVDEYGQYRFFTGPYESTGAENDTVLDLTDSNFEISISHNDNYNGTLFSQIEPVLLKKASYLIRIKHATNDAVQTRFTVTRKRKIEKLAMDKPAAFTISQEDKQGVLLYQPEYAGSYTLKAEPDQAGTTKIEVYRDLNMTDLMTESKAGENQLTLDLEFGEFYYISLKSERPGQVSSGQFTALLNSIQISPELPANIDVDATKKPLPFTFKPSKSGEYQFITTNYQFSGPECDTLLQVYSDENYTNLIASNDNTDKGNFAELTLPVTANSTYYIKLTSNPSPERLTTTFYMQSGGQKSGTVVYEYNDNNRLVFVIINGGETTFEYIYDDNGNLKEKIKY